MTLTISSSFSGLSFNFHIYTLYSSLVFVVTTLYHRSMLIPHMVATR
jgi:hypothetical protein